MLDILIRSLEYCASKEVSSTDVEKAAYVLNAAQNEILRNAGHIPNDGGGNQYQSNISFIFPSTSGNTIISGLYYNSIRADPARTPEARIGRAFSGLIREGDELMIGVLRNTLYALNLTALQQNPIYGAAVSPVPRQIYSVMQYQRSPSIAAQTRARAGSNCEMPGCTQPLFRGLDGNVYLEVHHITPLSENGADNLTNTAALCPTCHRAQHYAIDSAQRRQQLQQMRRQNP
ncbi:HNH endonuclease [Asaia lannensis]|uniref:HNH endonuclease n=1 Tax=Asaia lannensis NBRC 102526 TaxID=1307926 RepID=A0ABT1CJG8_9PROT|nr:HNH endonuclease signature motif containing protein [Asaia lannensis]MCO6161015.1 HNH endonuclease [Asaia lannensis NBRC 102526]